MHSGTATLSRSGIEKLSKAIAAVTTINKIYFQRLAIDGEMIENCLERWKDLPQLRCINFTNPFKYCENSAQANALKWNILKPLQQPFAFPAIEQLRFLGCGFQLNKEMYESVHHGNIMEEICQEIKRFKPHCSVEFYDCISRGLKFNQ